MCLLLLTSSHQSELAFVFILWHKEWDWCCEKAEWSGPLTTVIGNKIAPPIIVCCFIENYWIIHNVRPAFFHLKYTAVFFSPNYFHIIHWISNYRCIHGSITKVGYSFSDHFPLPRKTYTFLGWLLQVSHHGTFLNLPPWMSSLSEIYPQSSPFTTWEEQGWLYLWLRTSLLNPLYNIRYSFTFSCSLSCMKC